MAKRDPNKEISQLYKPCPGLWLIPELWLHGKSYQPIIKYKIIELRFEMSSTTGESGFYFEYDQVNCLQKQKLQFLS